MSKFYIYPESNINNWDSGNFEDINDPFSAADDDTTVMQRTSAGSDDVTTRLNLTAFSASATSINSVTGVVRIRRSVGSGGQATVGVQISGVDHYGTLTNLGSTFVNFTKLWLTNPQSAAAWTVADLNALIGSSRTTAPGTGRTYRWTQMYFEIDYVGAPIPLSPALDTASRRLHGYGTNRSMVSLSVAPHLGFDSMPGALHRVQHIAGVHPTDKGWKGKIWQHRFVRAHSVTVKPGGDAGNVSIRYHDLRPKLTFLRDDAWTPKPANALGDGIVRMSALGATHGYTRSSLTWVDDPASRLFMQLVDNQEAHNYGGHGFYGPSKNWIVHSGFATGDITGWTKVGTGTNGSAITRELTQGGLFVEVPNIAALPGALWEPDSTGVIQHMQITAGNPNTVDTYLLSTASGTITANTKLWLSFVRAQGTGDPPLQYTVLRSVDGLYWDASDQTFKAGPVWNSMADTVTDRTWEYWTVPNQIDVGASNTTITLRIGWDDLAADGAFGAISAVCLEDGAVPSHAPILNAATALTRAAGTYTWQTPVWNGGAFGAFLCEVIPDWNAAMIGNTNKTIFKISLDSNNYDWGYYDGTNDRWVFERKAQGTVNRAVFSHSPTKLSPVKLCFRFCGTQGELDLAPYTASMFMGVAGSPLTKGTDVVCNNAPTAPTVDLELGANAGADYFDGIMRLFRVVPYVPTDQEVTRLFSLVG